MRISSSVRSLIQLALPWAFSVDYLWLFCVLSSLFTRECFPSPKFLTLFSRLLRYKILDHLFTFLRAFLAASDWENISNIRDSVSQISQHLEVRQKYCAARRIFDSSQCHMMTNSLSFSIFNFRTKAVCWNTLANKQAAPSKHDGNGNTFLMCIKDFIATFVQVWWLPSISSCKQFQMFTIC